MGNSRHLTPVLALAGTLSGCPKVELPGSPYTGAAQVEYHYLDFADNAPNNTHRVDTDPRGFPNYSDTFNGPEASKVLGELVETIWKVQTACQASLGPPIDGKVHVVYTRPTTCHETWKRSGGAGMTFDDFLERCEQTFPPDLLAVEAVYSEQDETTTTCALAIEPVGNCLVRDKINPSSGEPIQRLNILCH